MSRLPIFSKNLSFKLGRLLWPRNGHWPLQLGRTAPGRIQLHD
jgi:hypothetical protein